MAKGNRTAAEVGALREAVSVHYNEVENRYGSGKVFATMLYGSQNYGLESPNSDVDTKTMLLPSIREVVLGKEMVSTDQVMPDGALSNVKDFRAMFQNYLKGNINFVETLFTDFYRVNPKFADYFEELRDHRSLIANARPLKLVHMAAGMANQKYVAFSKPFESKKEVLEKYGYDPKQLHHLARLSIFIHEYGDNMDFGAALKPPISLFDWLYSLKVEPLPLDGAQSLREDLMTQINYEVECADRHLPEDNGFREASDYLDDFTVRLLSNQFGISVLNES